MILHLRTYVPSINRINERSALPNISNLVVGDGVEDDGLVHSQFPDVLRICSTGGAHSGKELEIE